MTHLENQQAAVKLLGRACLNGFITAESFPENMGTRANVVCQRRYGKLSYFKERLKHIQTLVVGQAGC